MMRAPRTLFLYACCLLLLTGCWDRKELGEVSLVTGIAIDKGDKAKYKFTVESLNATALNPKTRGTGAPAIVFTLQGDDISELADKMNIGLSRHAIFSHMRTVVIGKEIAKEGMFELFDYMERSRQIRNDFNVLVADGVPAHEVLQITYPIQKVPTLKINRQLKTLVEDWGGDPDIRMRDIIDALVSPGREPVTAVIRINGDPKKGMRKENLESTQPEANVVMDGMGIYKGMKYLGEVSTKDTRNYLWITDKLRRTTVTVPCETGSLFSVRVQHSKTDIQAAYLGHKPHITVDVDFESRIKSFKCGEDVSELGTLSAYEKLVEEAVEKELLSTIELLQQKYQSDIFGFGEHMERQAYRHFKEVKDDWNEEFARAAIEVHVTAKIQRSGLITKSFLNELL